jgi:hypothetical protein
VKNLANKEAGKYNFVGISLQSQGLREYLAANGYPFPVYTDMRDEDVKRYHLGSTPETIVVNPAGTVLKSWVGAYQGSVKSDVEAFFKLGLDSGAPPA